MHTRPNQTHISAWKTHKSCISAKKRVNNANIKIFDEANIPLQQQTKKREDNRGEQRKYKKNHTHTLSMNIYKYICC